MSTPKNEESQVSSKPTLEIEELTEENSAEVSGAGLGGMVAGARNAMEAASGIGGTFSQTIRAGVKGAKSGIQMNTETANLEGSKLGRDLVLDERYKASLGK